MKQVVIHPPWKPWLGNRLFTEAEGCVYLRAFALWKEMAQAVGIALDTCDVVPFSRADLVWFMDLPREREVLSRARAAAPHAPIVLQILESPLLCPAAFIQANRTAFDHILSYEPTDANSTHVQYYLPVTIHPLIEGPSFASRQPAVMVNTNRIEGWFATRKEGWTGLPVIGSYLSGWRQPASHFIRPAAGELYSWRRRCARAFEKRRLPDLDVYGPGWNGDRISWAPWINRQPYTASRGPFVHRDNDKLSLLRHYRFTIAVENYRGHRGYISEKIFDSLQAGTIPVYLGDDQIHALVPPEAFVDARHFKSMDDLIDYILSCPESEWQRKRACAKAFLQDSSFSRYSETAFSKHLLALLRKWLTATA